MTIDYGPFGFLDRYDPGHICNGSGKTIVLISMGVCLPQWPNGEGIGLLNRRLWVRVLPGVFFFLVTRGEDA